MHKVRRVVSIMTMVLSGACERAKILSDEVGYLFVVWRRLAPNIFEASVGMSCYKLVSYMKSSTLTFQRPISLLKTETVERYAQSNLNAQKNSEETEIVDPGGLSQFICKLMS